MNVKEDMEWRRIEYLNILNLKKSIKNKNINEFNKWYEEYRKYFHSQPKPKGLFKKCPYCNSKLNRYSFGIKTILKCPHCYYGRAWIPWIYRQNDVAF